MTIDEKEQYESEHFRSYCDFRKFKHLSDDNDEVSLSLSHPGGGVTGEFIIEWIPLGGRNGTSPQIQCFNDSAHVLVLFADVIEAIYDRFEDSDYTPDELIELLDEIGFVNDDSYKGDYIPDYMFDKYQRNRKLKKVLGDES